MIMCNTCDTCDRCKDIHVAQANGTRKEPCECSCHAFADCINLSTTISTCNSDGCSIINLN